MVPKIPVMWSAASLLALLGKEVFIPDLISRVQTRRTSSPTPIIDPGATDPCTWPVDRAFVLFFCFYYISIHIVLLERRLAYTPCVPTALFPIVLSL